MNFCFEFLQELLKSFEKLYQTLERVFHQISKHFEGGYKNSTCTSFLNPLLSVWVSDETVFLVFDILREILEFLKGEENEMFQVRTGFESKVISFVSPGNQIFKHNLATSNNSLPLFCSGGRVHLW